MTPPTASVDARVEDCLGGLARVLLEEELSELYEQHAPALVRSATAFAGDAEAARDAVQDCFMRYFELRRGGMKMKKPKAWLARVVKNQLIDEGRKGQRQKTVNLTATQYSGCCKGSLNWSSLSIFAT